MKRHSFFWAQNDWVKGIWVVACSYLGFIYAVYTSDWRPALFIPCIYWVFYSLAADFSLGCAGPLQPLSQRNQLPILPGHHGRYTTFRRYSLSLRRYGNLVDQRFLPEPTTFCRTASHCRQSYDQVCREDWFSDWHQVHQLLQSSTVLISPRHLRKFGAPDPPSGGTHGLCISLVSDVQLPC